MSRYRPVGDVLAGRYFRLSTSENDHEWFRVRRHVESYTEIQPVDQGTAGELGAVRMVVSTAMVVPLQHIPKEV